MSSSLHLSPCISSDASELAQAHIAAFMPTPLHAAVMGKCSIELVQQITETSFREGIKAAINNEMAPKEQTSSHCHEDEKGKKYYLKVTDTATSEIAAYAVWIFLPNGYKPENDPNANFSPLPEGCNNTLWRVACDSVRQLRTSDTKRMTEGHWLLNLLGTHPRYRRRGAAAMLVEWGLKRADEEGKKCFVDAGGEGGEALYRRYGFVDVGELVLDLGAGNDGLKWIAMVKEAETMRNV